MKAANLLERIGPNPTPAEAATARELRIMIFEWVGKPNWNRYEWRILEQKIVAILRRTEGGQ